MSYISLGALGINPEPDCPENQLWKAEAGQCVEMRCGTGRKAYYGRCITDPDACPPGEAFDFVFAKCVPHESGVEVRTFLLVSAGVLAVLYAATRGR